MEIHAHHLHKAPGKKWTHYLFEFLMLFLAVFCGFLAENFREHRVAYHRVKQYARSLIHDLAEDTAMINGVMLDVKNIMNWTDSLSAYLKNKDIKQLRNIDLFVLAQGTDIYKPYTWNRATLEQIKNSGSLRYFSNDSLVSRISFYDALTKHLDEDFMGDDERANRAAAKRNQLVDLNYPIDFARAVRKNTDSVMKTAYFAELAKTGPTLLTKELNEIKILLNEKLTIKGHLYARIEFELPRLKKDATALIFMLKKEYHLQ